MEKIINGKILAKLTKEKVRQEVLELEKQGESVTLAVILVGDNQASNVYVKGKINDCLECSIKSSAFRLPKETSEEELLSLIDTLNRDENTNGILVQLPLPDHISESAVIDKIAPDKDVDCFTKDNVGKLFLGENVFSPCTPGGIVKLLKFAGVEISGKEVVVVGRSNIVGKPVSLMLLKENATVTMCHSRTKDIGSVTKRADILVVAVGIKEFVTRDMVKEGGVVVDVGMNKFEGKLYGDVNFDSVIEKVSKITPVPGGVGLMTRAVLMENTLIAKKLQDSKKSTNKASKRKKIN